MNHFARGAFQLDPKKQALLQALLQEEGVDSPIAQRISRRKDDDSVPLSFAQARLWFLEQLQPGTSIYHIPGVFRLQGLLNVAALQASFNEILRRHEALRTTFTTVEGQPIAALAKQLASAPTDPYTLSVVDLRNLPDTEREAVAQKRAIEEMRRPFDLGQGPLLRTTLLRLGEEEYILLVILHHIIADGWSLELLMRELGVFYETATNKPSQEQTTLLELPIQYADFAAWQRQWLQGEVLETQLSYWKQQLSGNLPVLQLPRDRPRPSSQTFRGKSQSFVLPQTLSRAIKALASSEGATLYMVLLAAFKTLLYRYTGQEDILVGSPVGNRNRTEIEGLIGVFVNTLVMRTQLDGNLSFREVLGRVREVVLGADAHQDLPFEKLVDELQPERNMSYSPLFQIMFVLQNAPLESIEFSGLTLKPIALDTGTAQFDLTFDVSETTEGINCKVEYSTDLFDDTTISQMIRHFQTLLEGIIVDCEQRISELPLLTEAERHQLLVEWNDTQTEYPQDKCIHQLFEAQVEQTPDAEAVVFEDKQLTYRELNRRANQVAHHLRSLGVEPDDLVGLCVERSLEMVVGLLGILKAGGAYVPLDPAYPRERLELMLSDAQVSVLLTTEKLMARLPEHRAHVVYLDTHWKTISQENEANLVSRVNSQNLAYVIYTSGSTGKPKGVMIQHQSLVSFAKTAIFEYGLTKQDRILQFASLSFDVAAEEIYPCLSCGGTVVLRTDEMLNSVAEFVHKCREWQLTVLDLPTAYWHQLTSELASGNLVLPDSLRLVIFGGERSLPEMVQKWQKCVGDRPQLVNAYGPTEATVEATMYKFSGSVPKDLLWREVPIGRPIGNVQVYLLDEHLQLVPIGIPGELHIGGTGLARGYLNRSELTAEKFISNPFSDEDNELLYKTGDLARYLADGTLEYIGRIDNQVKIRGFRIELGEVEAALSQHPNVRESAVILREDYPGDKRLVAYVVPSHESGNQQTGQIELWPSVGEYPVYDELLYYAMTTDEQRNHSYKVAINQLVRDKVVVEIGTGKDAILARFCVEAGAKKVYAIEISEEAFRLAISCIQSLGLSDKITLIHGDATKVNLPEMADVCVSEIIGTIGGSEGAAVILNNARRFLKQDGVMIPQKSITKIAAARLPDQLLQNPSFTKIPGYYTQKVFEKVGYPFDLKLCIKGFPHSTNIISDAATFEYLDFTKNIDFDYCHEVRLKVNQNSRIDGFLLWLNLYTLAGEIIDNLKHDYSWLPVYLPVFCPGIEVFAGDIIQAFCIGMLSENKINPDYKIRGSLIRNNGEVIEFEHSSYYHKKLFKQTPFYERLFSQFVGDLSPHDISNQEQVLTISQLRNFLKEKLPEYMMPSALVILEALPLTPNGKVDRHRLLVSETITPELESTYVGPRNRVEEMLAGIWADVLRLKQVSIHDNFFELGGDSIIAIQIIARANQADLKLVTKQLFQHQTIAQLATVAVLKQTIQAEQELVTGSVSLTPIQHWFFEQNLHDPHHWNQTLALEMQQVINLDLLEQALQQLLLHHDALRLQFEQSEFGWQQVIASQDMVVPLTGFDFSALAKTEQKLAFKAAATELQTSFNLSVAPLVRVAFCNFGVQQPSRLLLVIHHLAMDIFAWRILLEDLQTAYQQLSQGRKVQLSAKTTSFKYWSEHLEDYAQSVALQSEWDYWLTEFRKQVAPLPVDFPNGDNTAASERKVSVSLSVEQTQALLQDVPQAYNTQIIDVLLTALVQAFSQWTGDRSLFVALANHGREKIFDDLELSRTVGWFTSIFPVLLDLGKHAHPGEALKTVKEQLRSIPNRGIGYGILRYLSKNAERVEQLRSLPQPEVVFNYLGQFDQTFAKSSLFRFVQNSSGLASSPQNKRSALLEINGLVVSGEMRFELTYSEKIHRQSTIERLAQEFIKALQALISHCQSSEARSYTPSDFPEVNLNQKDLDQFLAKINRPSK